MKTTEKHDKRMAEIMITEVFPLYLTKVERKGRTRSELLCVIEWLTGFNERKLSELIAENATFERFFAEATLNDKASLITGTICGYKIQEIENPLTRKVRYLDKLVDELAQGKKMEKILRTHTP